MRSEGVDHSEKIEARSHSEKSQADSIDRGCM